MAGLSASMPGGLGSLAWAIGAFDLLVAAVMPLWAKAPYLTGCTLLHAVAWAWLSVNRCAG